MTEPTSTPRSLPQRARQTPYELVFTEGDFESRVFPRIRAEAEEQLMDPHQTERFEFLTTASDVLRDVIPEDAPPEAIEQYRSILFHAYHFWEADHRLYVVDGAVSRYLVESAPRMEGWAVALPTRAAYVQLPANLFWSSISAETPPEPVDGFFLTLAEEIAPVEGSVPRLEILVTLGIRRQRAGFSIIPLRTSTDADTVEAWKAEVREDGDFANTLPGGEIEGLYSMLTTAEVLKLVGRILWYIDTFPEGLIDVDAPEPREDDSQPPSTRLGYVRVTLTGSTAPGS